MKVKKYSRLERCRSSMRYDPSVNVDSHFVETTLLNSQAKSFFNLFFLFYYYFFFVQAVLGNDPLETCLI